MKRHFKVLENSGIALALAVLVAVGTSCKDERRAPPPTPPPSTAWIDTPTKGETVTSLPSISGGFNHNGGGVVPIQSIRVTLYRDKDGYAWNGTAWVNPPPRSTLTPEFQIATTFQFDIPGNIDGKGTWQCTGTLPSGANLSVGAYMVEVTMDLGGYRTTNGHPFLVGISAPPIITKPYGWGYNGNGEVGAGPGPSVNVPTKIKTSGALDGKFLVDAASGAEHAMALSSEGKVYTWGYNGFGELGRGSGNFTSSDEPVPVDTSGVLSGKRVVAIGAGDYHSFAVTSQNQVMAWGRNDNGELGNGVTGGVSTAPVLVHMGGALNGKVVKAITGGDHHTLALTVDGKLYAWGANGDGQLGTGNNTPSNVPVAVTGFDGKIVSAVEAGVFHTLVLTTEGKVYAFGLGAGGRLGNGGTASSNVPVEVGTTGDMAGKYIVQISATRHHSLALSTEGKVYAWGENAQNGLGDPSITTFVATPFEVEGNLTGKSVFYIGTGWYSSYAITRDRKMFAWGNNYDGNLAGAIPAGFGAQSPLEANTTGVLTTADSVAALDAGWRHAVMLTAPRLGPEPDVGVEANVTDIKYGDELNFGSNGIGATNTVKITLRNFGDDALTDLALSGPTSDFTFDPLPQTTLAPKASMEFNAYFTPSGTGQRDGNLTISSSDPDEHQFPIKLRGTGLALGNLVAGFGSLAITGQVYATAVQTDGKVLIGGAFSQVGGIARNNLARLNADGTLDSFNPNVTGQVNCIAIQRDGNIVIGGGFTQVGGTGRNRLARINDTGVLDASFDPNVVDGTVFCLYISTDNTILVGGSFSQIGSTVRSALQRLFSTGSVDTGFTPAISGGFVRCVTKQSGEFSNLILIGGTFSTVSGQPRTRLARLENDGFIDTDFTANAANGHVYSVAMQPDGQILVAGEFDAINGTTRNRIARVSQTGAVDVTYNPNVAGSIYSMALQANGGVLIGGTITSVGGTARNRVARIKADGSLDANFSPSVTGGAATVNGTVIQADGKIFLAGDFTAINGITRNNFAQITNVNASQVVVTNDPNILDQVRWFINEGSPQTSDATLEKSTNGGASWTPIGNGARLLPPQTGWQWLSAGSLPVSGLLRLRAIAQGGYSSGSSSVIEKVFTYNGPPAIKLSHGFNPNVANNSTFGYGSIRAGEASTAVLTITNIGGQPLTGFADANMTGLNPGEFEVVPPSVNTLAPGASVNFSVIYKPRTVGSHVAFLNIPTNATVIPIFSLVMNGTAGQPIGTWRAQNFGQSDNAGASQDAADPDEDGNSNLAEYALGLNPNVSNGNGGGTITSGGGGGGSFAPPGAGGEGLAPPPSGTFFFNYTRSKLALADVSYQVEWSDTLDTNDWHATDVVESQVVEVGDTQQVQVTIPNGSAGRRFVRLRMTRVY